MKKFLAIVSICWLMVSCDDDRVYDTNVDMDERQWLVTEKPVFDFAIHDTVISYDVYCNVRNAVSYPFRNLYFNFELLDSAGTVVQSKLMTANLFEKSGEPLGDSGLGDIYDHRIPVLQKFNFPYAGKFQVRLSQEMRVDTLSGVLAVGARVERNMPSPQ